MSVIRKIAKTIETTVMIDVTMLLRMSWATPGSCCDGNRTVGILLIPLIDSSRNDSAAPAAPSNRRLPKCRPANFLYGAYG